MDFPGRIGSAGAEDVPWRYYLDTAVYLESADRRGTVTPVSGAGGDRPPLGPCHVIAAVQPDSEPDSQENLARLEVLDRELQAAAIASIRATGTSIEGNHREEGRAVFGYNPVPDGKGVGFFIPNTLVPIDAAGKPAQKPIPDPVPSPDPEPDPAPAPT